MEYLYRLQFDATASEFNIIQYLRLLGSVVQITRVYVISNSVTSLYAAICNHPVDLPSTWEPRVIFSDAEDVSPFCPRRDTPNPEDTDLSFLSPHHIPTPPPTFQNTDYKAMSVTTSPTPQNFVGQLPPTDEQPTTSTNSKHAGAISKTRQQNRH